MRIRFLARLSMEVKGTNQTCECQCVFASSSFWFIIVVSLSAVGLSYVDASFIQLQEDGSHHLAGCPTRLCDHERGDLWSLASHCHGRNQESRLH